MSEYYQKVAKGEICPYCKKPPKLVDSSVIYGKSYGNMYLCKSCNAWVGVHKRDNKEYYYCKCGVLKSYVYNISSGEKTEVRYSYPKNWRK